MSSTPDFEISSGFHQFTNVQIINACRFLQIQLTRAAKCSRLSLIAFIASLSIDDIGRIQLELSEKPFKVRTARKRKFEELEVDLESMNDDVFVDQAVFLEVVPEDVVKDCVVRFIERTGNNSLRNVICVSCSRRVWQNHSQFVVLNDIPNRDRLRPAKSHRRHQLTSGILLYKGGFVDFNQGFICLDCISYLGRDLTPPLSLANNMWIGKFPSIYNYRVTHCITGEIPFDLKILTFSEHILIARYFPCAYIIKLFPKDCKGRSFKSSQLHSGLKGNVSTYPLDTSAVAEWIDGRTMPPSVGILSSIVGITFVGPNNLPERTLPSIFNVRHDRVRAALCFLLTENPIFRDIVISENRLSELPINGVPDELFNVTRYSDDVSSLNREQDGYIPSQDPTSEGASS